MVGRLALGFSLVAATDAHGFMISPVARQSGAPSFDQAGTLCPDNSCGWFSNQVAIRGNPTVCDRSLLTSKLWNQGVNTPCGKYDPFRTKPWRAPGSAPILSPCGVDGGQKGHTDGTKLAPKARTTWQRGSAVEVAQSVTANHGGGYAYRLCPVSESPTEACFQAHHLAFADHKTTVRFVDGSTKSIAATRTTIAGRQWTRNPIPKDTAFFPAPFPGGSGVHWSFSLVDRVAIPSDLPTGNYVVSWRWDCELTPQVWTNCGDVTIVDSAVDSTVDSTVAV